MGIYHVKIFDILTKPHDAANIVYKNMQNKYIHTQENTFYKTIWPHVL